MLAHHKLPLFLWPEAVAYATYLKNRSPTRALSMSITPEEAFSGKKPDASMLQEFGSPCWVLEQDRKNHKMEPKARQFIFVGLSDEARAWRYYNPNTRQILTSRNVTFVNDTPSSEIPIRPAEIKGEQPNLEESPDNDLDTPSTPVSEISTDLPVSTPMPNTEQGHGKPAATNPLSKREQPHRSTKTIKPNYTDSLRPSAHLTQQVFITEPNTTNDPASVPEAQARPDWPQWLDAMNAEIEALKGLDTFTLTDLPRNRQAIGSKWVYRIKRDENGDISHYRARLVAKGFSQIPGIDFDETFAPVVRLDTIRLLLALSARYKRVTSSQHTWWM